MCPQSQDPGYRHQGSFAVVRFFVQLIAMLCILLITVPWVALTATALLLFSLLEWVLLGARRLLSQQE